MILMVFACSGIILAMIELLGVVLACCLANIIAEENKEKRRLRKINQQHLELKVSDLQYLCIIIVLYHSCTNQYCGFLRSIQVNTFIYVRINDAHSSDYQAKVQKTSRKIQTSPIRWVFLETKLTQYKSASCLPSTNHLRENSNNGNCLNSAASAIYLSSTKKFEHFYILKKHVNDVQCH